ncbi:MAG: N-acetylmuramoyl-L-alanine amidase [Bdellovibrionales bacterium]
MLTSPNYNERKNAQDPSMIVLHYTGMKTADAALERLCDPQSEVSAHYVVEENGRVHHLVPDDKRAWHAGGSYWAGETDINSASIGIEIVNPGHEFGYAAFPDKQIEAVMTLCQKLLKTYNVPAHNVLGHSDIAITRKIDPGHLFPWAVLARAGIGLWPAPNEMDFEAAKDLVENKAALAELLHEYGYDPSKPLPEIVTAFHRRFLPERFSHWGDAPDTPDIDTAAKLLSLIRQAHEVT